MVRLRVAVECYPLFDAIPAAFLPFVDWSLLAVRVVMVFVNIEYSACEGCFECLLYFECVFVTLLFVVMRCGLCALAH